jgi:hypothetical protein
LNGPKSREETPKEGSDTRQGRIPHRINIAPQRTKFKRLIHPMPATVNPMHESNSLQRYEPSRRFRRSGRFIFWQQFGQVEGMNW